jgi:hypothetical protein
MREDEDQHSESNRADIMWWLNLCINLTGLRDTQIPGKILALYVSVRVFLE